MQAPRAMRLSPSMESVVASLSSESEVTAWDVLRALLSIHPEYGGGMARQLLAEADVTFTQRRHIEDWIAALIELFDPDRVLVLHGRLVVLGLCRLDRQLRDFLEERGMPDAMRSELTENFDSLLRASEFLVPGATSDHVEKGAPDLLDIENEVRTIAHLITSKRVKPPLSLGLFGDWGTGKTFFITKLQEYVSGIAAHYDAVERDSGTVSEWCTRVVQIEFNAWHYSDSNLWATLVSRIHDELRKEIHPEEDLKKLLEQRARDAAAEQRQAEEQLDAARKRIAAASEKLAATEREVVAKQNRLTGLIGTLRVLLKSDTATQVQLEKAAKAVGMPEAAEAYDALEELNESLSSATGRVWSIVKSMIGVPQLALLVIAVIAAPWVVSWVLDTWGTSLGAVAQSVMELSTILIGGAAWLTAYIHRGTKYLDVIEQAVEQARVARQRTMTEDKEVAAAARELAVARSEEEGARAVLAAAKAELQQVQAELNELTPERRLFRLLEERSRSAAYTKHLGIISLIREDFETISNLLIEMEKERATAATRAPIQRIVLYIDDLDRCRPERVVEVLEAVHMLLAFPIFTVIVAVDPRWLRQSLLERYPRNLSPTGNDTDEDIAGATPLNYLEKIFQIPFALRRVEQRGYEQLVDTLLQPPRGLLDPVRRTAPSGNGQQVAATGGDARHRDDGAAAVGERVARIIPAATRQLEFTDQEKQDIRKLWSLFATPRNVKRFINTYRLLRVSIPADQRAAFEQSEYRIPLILLAVVTSSSDEMYLFQSGLREWAAGLDAQARRKQWTWTDVFDALLPSLGQQDADWPAIDAAVRTAVKDAFETRFAVDKLLEWAERVARYSFAVVPDRPSSTAKQPRRRATDRGRLRAELKQPAAKPGRDQATP